MKTPHPHQEKNIAMALENAKVCGARWLFGNETGIGKTGEAITFLKRYGWTGDILVVSEAITRVHWRKELAAWWPERFEDPASVGIVNMGMGRKNQTKKQQAAWPQILGASARVVSYDLLDPARDYRRGQAVILDEAHLLINANAKRSRNIREIAQDHNAPLLQLTATPQPDRPEQIWNPLSILCPMRYGRNPKSVESGAKAEAAFAFLQRYIERVPGQYGSAWGKVRPEHADELRWRIEQIMSRTTRGEIAHLIPPVQIVNLPQQASRDPDSLVAEWTYNRTQEVPHVIVLVHKRKRAAALCSLLKEKFPEYHVAHVTGAVPAEKRNALLDAAHEAPRSIIVATMCSITRGISLSWVKRGLFAELYWRPETLIQVSGRFPRLDNLDGIPPLLEVLCQAGSLEERQSQAIADKLAEIHATTKAGQTDEAIKTAVTPDAKTLEQMLRDAAWQPDWVSDVDEQLDYEDDLESDE